MWSNIKNPSVEWFLHWKLGDCGGSDWESQGKTRGSRIGGEGNISTKFAGKCSGDVEPKAGTLNGLGTLIDPEFFKDMFL